MTGEAEDEIMAFEVDNAGQLYVLARWILTQDETELVQRGAVLAITESGTVTVRLAGGIYDQRTYIPPMVPATRESVLASLQAEA